MLSRRFFAVVSFAAIWCIHPILAQETNFDKLQRRAIDKANSPSKALQVILVGDTFDDRLAADVDVARMQRIIYDSFSQDELSIVITLVGAKVNREELFRALSTLPAIPGPKTILVYISSHGEYRGTEHVLQLGDDEVNRGDIVNAINELQPQLGVLITDACAQKEDIDPQNLLNVENWEEGKKLIDHVRTAKALPTNKRMVRDLFLWHHGIVDVNACMAGQQAVADVKFGGYFTTALALASCHDQKGVAPPPLRAASKLREGKKEGIDFRISPTKIDRDGNDFVDWREFLETLVRNYLAIFHGSANQTPWVLRTNGREFVEKGLPSEIQVYVGIASGMAQFDDGPREVGLGRTILISADEAAVTRVISVNFPNRQDVIWASDQESAEKQMKTALLQSFAGKRVNEDSIKISVRPKGAPPEKKNDGIPPQPGRANVNNQAYMEWLKMYHPDAYKRLQSGLRK